MQLSDIFRSKRKIIFGSSYKTGSLRSGASVVVHCCVIVGVCLQAAVELSSRLGQKSFRFGGEHGHVI